MFALGLVCSSFPNFIRWKVQFFTWDLFYYRCVPFMHCTVLAAFHKFQNIMFSFFLVTKYFLIFLVTFLLKPFVFRSMLSDFYIFVNFPTFFSYWYLISFHRGQRTYFIWLDPFYFILWPNVWFVENILHVLEKNVYSIVGWSILSMSVGSGWFIVLSLLFPCWFSI